MSKSKKNTKSKAKATTKTSKAANIVDGFNPINVGNRVAKKLMGW